MLAVLYRAPLTEGERWRLAGLAAFMAAQLAFLTCWRRQYLRWRTPLVAVSRAQGLLVPVLVLDTLRALQPTLQPSPAAGGDGMGSSSSGGVAAALRSVVVLLVPLAWVDACFLGAVGHPLPPLLHVAVQSVSMGLLAWRAPTGQPCGPWRRLKAPRGLPGLQACLAGTMDATWGRCFPARLALCLLVPVVMPELPPLSIVAC